MTGDLPPKIVKEFAPELAKPVQIIFNSITRTGEYPRQWVREEQIVIPKKYPVDDLEGLRSLSKTAFFSKTYEACLRDWILPMVKPFLDPANYGGMKNNSTMFYLLHLLHFLHSHLDNPIPHAVLLAQADLKGAFNRVSHQHVILNLFDMHIPGWLLRIVASYLSGRNMTLKF